MNFEGKEIIIDACCLINLYATGRIEDILDTIPSDFFVAKYVKNDEALKIKKNNSYPFQYEPLNIEPQVKKGLLRVIQIESKKEITTFVNFATTVDDGEARCGSLALHRSLVVATDDKAAITLFSNYNHAIQTISTPELVKAWVKIKNPNAVITQAVLRKIENHASYCPSSGHSLFSWWQKNN